MQNQENPFSEVDQAMSTALPTLMEDPFHRVHSAPDFQRRGSDADTGISCNGSRSLSRTGSTTSTRSSSPTASLSAQPHTLIDKIQVITSFVSCVFTIDGIK